MKDGIWVDYLHLDLPRVWLARDFGWDMNRDLTFSTSSIYIQKHARLSNQLSRVLMTAS
jgi:hypothetical protein